MKVEDIKDNIRPPTLALKNENVTVETGGRSDPNDFDFKVPFPIKRKRKTFEQDPRIATIRLGKKRQTCSERKSKTEKIKNKKIKRHNDKEEKTSTQNEKTAKDHHEKAKITKINEIIEENNLEENLPEDLISLLKQRENKKPFCLEDFEKYQKYI